MDILIVGIATVIVSFWTYVGWRANELMQWQTKMRHLHDKINIALKRRHDLAYSLVAAVKVHSIQETNIFTETIDARNKALLVEGGSTQDISQTEQVLDDQLKKLLALQEAYPRIKDSESFRLLHEDLIQNTVHLDELLFVHSFIVQLYTGERERFWNFASRRWFKPVEQFDLHIVAH